MYLLAILLFAPLVAAAAAFDLNPCIPHKETPLILLDHVSWPQHPIAGADLKLALNVYNQAPFEIKNITVHTEASTGPVKIQIEPFDLCAAAAACPIMPGPHLIETTLNVPNAPLQISLKSTWLDHTGRTLLCLEAKFKPKWSLRSLF